jgi:hypothetical protein
MLKQKQRTIFFASFRFVSLPHQYFRFLVASKWIFSFDIFKMFSSLFMSPCSGAGAAKSHIIIADLEAEPLRYEAAMAMAPIATAPKATALMVTGTALMFMDLMVTAWLRI